MKSEEHLSEEFTFDDLFYSRTNKKGIIQSGNIVFQRVSKFSFDELINKPHSIVRHPQMPRGVFYLLWSYLLEGRPIGAYVQNLTKDRKPYWVFTVASPVEDGFLSIRLKPSSSIFKIVETKYQQLLQIEQQRKVSPQESSEILINEIKGMGFTSYNAFMAEALSKELESRNSALKNDDILMLKNLNKFLEYGNLLREKAAHIEGAYKKNSMVSMNLEVQSAKIGHEAQSVVAVSNQYRKFNEEIQIEIRKFVSTTQSLIHRVRDCQFAVANFLLQSEMKLKFNLEETSELINKDNEITFLKWLTSNSIQKAKEQLYLVESELETYRKSYDEVRQIVLALEIVNISGKIEVVKLKTEILSLGELMKELNNYKNSLKTTLREIEVTFTDLGYMARDLIKEITQHSSLEEDAISKVI